MVENDVKQVLYGILDILYNLGYLQEHDQDGMDLQISKLQQILDGDDEVGNIENGFMTPMWYN